MFPLSVEIQRAYVEQITQAGLTAMRIRGCEVSSESESKTRQEAEGLVQGTYSQSKSFEEMLGKITKMVKKLDPFTQANTFLLNRPLLARLVSAAHPHPLVQRDPALPGLMAGILQKGEDAATLVMHMDEVLKANSLVKAYRLQEAETLLGLAPRIDKLYGAAVVYSTATATATTAAAAATAGTDSGIAMDIDTQGKQQMHISSPSIGANLESEYSAFMQVCTDVLPRVAEAVRGLALSPGLHSQVSLCIQELGALVQAYGHRAAGAGAGAGAGIWPGDRIKSPMPNSTATADTASAAGTRASQLALTMCRLLTALVVSQRAASAATAPSPTPVIGEGVGVGAQSNVVAGYPQAPIFNLGLRL
jgi:hypothetical protein